MEHPGSTSSFLSLIVSKIANFKFVSLLEAERFLMIAVVVPLGSFVDKVLRGSDSRDLLLKIERSILLCCSTCEVTSSV